jgi:hypothetical protein
MPSVVTQVHHASSAGGAPLEVSLPPHHQDSALWRELEATWAALVERWLPLSHPEEIWRSNRQRQATDPMQGWKLHLSATVLSASELLATVAPVLSASGSMFKATATLLELKKLNCGLFYGYSQIGKCVTVYPDSAETARQLARGIDRLTQGLPGPSVPSDAPLRPGSRVFYRYGSFSSSLEIVYADGARIPAIRTPSGELVPDSREPGFAVPPWMQDENPFAAGEDAEATTAPGPPTPLQTRIRAYEAIARRGKGGVYRALDIGATPPRLAILKEGRRHGETEPDGRDGYWRVRHEAAVLSALQHSRAAVPAVYTTFTIDDRFYLACEAIDGEDLQTLLGRRKRRLPLRRALDFGAQTARIMADLHAAGWVWRDCKPMNLIVGADDRLRPIDFEGASAISSPDTSPWGTGGYLAQEWAAAADRHNRVPEDLHALGVTLHQLFTGITPAQDAARVPVEQERPRLPAAPRALVADLTSADPSARPSAHDAACILESARRRLETSRNGR